MFRHRPALGALLQDVVDGGASVGFVPPLGADEAAACWDSAAAALKGGGRRLWIARAAGGGIVGTVQLGRTTLVLDTRLGDPSEALYRGMGGQPAGTIPRYARSADGTLHTTAFYYKLL